MRKHQAERLAIREEKLKNKARSFGISLYSDHLEELIQEKEFEIQEKEQKERERKRGYIASETNKKYIQTASMLRISDSIIKNAAYQEIDYILDFLDGITESEKVERYNDRLLELIEKKKDERRDDYSRGSYPIGGGRGRGGYIGGGGQGRGGYMAEADEAEKRIVAEADDGEKVIAAE